MSGKKGGGANRSADFALCHCSTKTLGLPITLKTEIDEEELRTPVERTPIAGRTPTQSRSLEQVAMKARHGGTALKGEDDGVEDDEADSEDSVTGWTSSSEEEDDDEDQTSDASLQGQEQTPEAEAARAAERLQVLEAAGLLIRNEGNNTQPLPGARRADSLLQRRKATRRPSSSSQEGDTAKDAATATHSRTTKGPRPEAPARRRPTTKRPAIPKPERDLPPPPVPKPEEQMEDAYDRFLKLQKETMSPPRDVATPASAAILPVVSPKVRPSTPASPTPGTGTPSSHATEQGKASGFLSSLTSSLRGKTAAASERRPTPVISGPMSAAAADRPLSSSSSDAAPTASTWSSFMDATTLLSLPESERKRQEAIFELCQTETTHVRDLQTIVEVFYNRIVEETGLMDEKARLVVFANIEDVLLTAVSFLSDLEERQRASRLYVDTIGDVLAEHMPSMKVYLPYCTNQGTAAQILTAERARQPALDQLLVQLRSSPAGRGLDLSSYLLTPMQRITRYPLLLSQILKYTQEDHVDHPFLTEALKNSQYLLTYTNERIRERQSEERLKVLSQTLFVGSEARVDLTKPTRFLGARRILREDASLLKRKSKTGRKLTLVLCNDVLVILTGGNHLYRMPAPLEEVVVRPLKAGRAAAAAAAVGAGEDTEGPGGFQIVMAGGTDKVDLKTTSQRAAHLWMRDIEEARSHCLDAALRAPRSPPVDGDKRRSRVASVRA